MNNYHIKMMTHSVTFVLLNIVVWSRKASVSDKHYRWLQWSNAHSIDRSPVLSLLRTIQAADWWKVCVFSESILYFYWNGLYSLHCVDDALWPTNHGQIINSICAHKWFCKSVLNIVTFMYRLPLCVISQFILIEYGMLCSVFAFEWWF